MADRFCGNCGNELRPEDRFCPGCGKAVHETAVVPTPEADVPTPPPAPLQKADTRTRRPEGVADHFKRLEIKL